MLDLPNLPRHFNFVSIDIEGMSLDVLRKFVRTYCGVPVEAFCIDGPSDAVMPILGPDYCMVWDANNVNTIAVRR